MKGNRLSYVGLLCIALLVASGAFAEKPDKSPNPNKPDKTPGLTTECIIFTADLEAGATLESAGATKITGCCPNAGPSPDYTMAFHNMCYRLEGDETEYCLPEVATDGYLFINNLGTGPNSSYKFQFWTWDADEQFTNPPGAGDFFVEMRGGIVVRDRKAKTLTVTFVDETAAVWIYFDRNWGCDPDDPGCDLCDGVEPECNPSSDENCHFPCNEGVSISNVGFELFRTSNLDYCE